jgi:hypothetical protein
MARHTTLYPVTDEGRDKGKKFLITEMDADKAEAWATRILFALMKANVELPENFSGMGAAGLAELGLKAIGSLTWESAKPLLDEMMEGIEIHPDPKHPQVKRAIMPEDMEEITTRLKIRVEVWKLNLGFLQAVIPSFSAGIKAAMGSMSQPNTQTSPDVSVS